LTDRGGALSASAVVLAIGVAVQSRHPLLDGEPRFAGWALDEHGERVVLRWQHAHPARRTREGDGLFVAAAMHLGRGGRDVDGHALTHGADVGGAAVVVRRV